MLLEKQQVCLCPWVAEIISVRHYVLKTWSVSTDEKWQTCGFIFKAHVLFRLHWCFASSFCISRHLCHNSLPHVFFFLARWLGYKKSVSKSAKTWVRCGCGDGPSQHAAVVWWGRCCSPFKLCLSPAAGQFLCYLHDLAAVLISGITGYKMVYTEAHLQQGGKPGKGISLKKKEGWGVHSCHVRAW